MVLLSSHNIYFGLEKRKFKFWYSLLTKGLTLLKTFFFIWQKLDVDGNYTKAYIVHYLL